MLPLLRARARVRHWLIGAALAAGAGAGAGCEAEGGAAGRPVGPAVTAVTIVGDDRMRFGPEEFVVARGTTVTLVLRNDGTMPKETMGHNLVILVPGTDPRGFAAAALLHPATAYVAPELKHRVVAATPVIGPGEEARVVFTVPAAAGDYPFVCSFPGHTPAGMRGVMRVR